jgi:aminomethyltransferase
MLLRGNTSTIRRMSRETAFYPRLTALTDRWMDLFGYAAPSVVTDTLEEYHAVRTAAGLMDFSMLRKVDVSGPGSVELVNSVVTRDLAKLKPMQIAYGALCNDDGFMIDDCTASISGDRVRFCGANDLDFGIFTEKAESTGLTVSELTDRIPHLCLQGPSSRDMLQSLADRDLSQAAFPYYTFREDVSIAGIPVYMTRLGYTAELGYEMWVDVERALDLWDALVEALAPGGMRVIGMDALDLFRIEGGFIIGGVEYDQTVPPFECGLGWAVDLEKVDFQGKAALVGLESSSEMRLTSVVLPSGGAAATGATLKHSGEQVGYVTQAVDSPYLGGKTLGLAKLRRPHNVPGTSLEASVDGSPVPAQVVQHPVYDPDRKRAKGLA